MGSTRQSLPGMISLAVLLILQVMTTTKSDHVIPAPTTWSVSESNVTCILLRASIFLTVQYTDVYNQSHLVELDVPASAKSSGSCGNGKQGGQQNIILSWDSESNHTAQHQLNNTLTLEFLANATGNASSTSGVVPHGLYALVKVTAVLHKIPELFPNVTNVPVPLVWNQETNSSYLAYPTTLNHSYVCASSLKISSTTESIPTAEITISLENSQVQAFRGKGDNKTFVGDVDHCAADEISSGSMVGTVILTISVIVLIALGVAALATYYLKKRRATGGTGYENM